MSAKQAKHNSIQNLTLLHSLCCSESDMCLQTRQNCGHATNLTVSDQFDDGASNAANAIKKFRRSADEHRLRKSNRLEFRWTVNVA